MVFTKLTSTRGSLSHPWSSCKSINISKQERLLQPSPFTVRIQHSLVITSRLPTSLPQQQSSSCKEERLGISQPVHIPKCLAASDVILKCDCYLEIYHVFPIMGRAAILPTALRVSCQSVDQDIRRWEMNRSVWCSDLPLTAWSTLEQSLVQHFLSGYYHVSCFVARLGESAFGSLSVEQAIAMASVWSLQLATLLYSQVLSSSVLQQTDRPLRSTKAPTPPPTNWCIHPTPLGFSRAEMKKIIILT